MMSFGELVLVMVRVISPGVHCCSIPPPCRGFKLAQASRGAPSGMLKAVCTALDISMIQTRTVSSEIWNRKSLHCHISYLVCTYALCTQCHQRVLTLLPSCVPNLDQIFVARTQAWSPSWRVSIMLNLCRIRLKSKTLPSRNLPWTSPRIVGATERRQFPPYNIAYFPYFIRKMADSRKRLTTEEVWKFFNDDKSLNESNS